MFFRSSKYTKIGPYGFSALLLITVAVLLRVVLISNGWPKTDSDEATMGLHALHILTRGEWPIFVYGQNYMGTIQAYLGACFFLLFGPSLFALRLGLVVLYAGFLLALYLLARLLYTKGVALATIFFLCLGSRDILAQLLGTYGGYSETLLFGTLSLLLASWLALSFHLDRDRRERPPEGAWRKRFIAYGSLGGVIGLGLWSDMLVLPFVCTSLLLLFLFCHRELRTRALFFGVLGFLIGFFPLLLFNIQHPSNNSLVTLWQSYTAGGMRSNLKLGILGTILFTIPTVTGANPLCPASTEVNLLWVHQLSLPCIELQVCWGLGVVIVWTLAVFVVVKELFELRQTFLSPESSAEKEHFVRCVGRLMLLISAGLLVLCYVVSPAANFPAATMRYLVGLLVATPAIVAFLWPRRSLGKVVLIRSITVWMIASVLVTTGYSIGILVVALPIVTLLWPRLWLSLGKTALTRLRTTGTIGKIGDSIKIGVLCFISTVLILGMINTFRQIPDAQELIRRQNVLINGLLRLHAPHIYSDYWTCNRLIFLSDERIVCSVIDVGWIPGWNRYEPYVQIVAQDHHPAYVFEMNSGPGDFQDQAVVDGISLNWTFTQHFAASYHRFNLAGFAIYLPVSNGPT